jgi:hypothetical protein
MATRYKFTDSTTAPAVSPATQAYSHSNPTNLRRQLLTTDSSALATTAYTPDAADHLVAGDSLHRQYVSNPMAASITFTSGDTIKWALQCLEAHTNNNLNLAIFVSIVSEDGNTVRRTLLAKTEEPTELATSLTNRFHSTTQTGATYTTVAGDRLVVEISVEGTPASAGGVQGHNASIRWGGAGAGGFLGENDTDTGTTLNPWIEFVPTITDNVTPTRGRVSWAELEVPFKATRGRVSWAELEVPLVGTRGRVSFAELEVPVAPTRGRVSFAEVEVPNPPGDPTRGRVSWVELEVPTVATRGRVSWVELEVPLAPTRGRVSFIELEVPTAPTRGRVSQAEFEVPSAPTRGRVSWVELEVPEVGFIGRAEQRLSIHIGIRIS